MASGGLGRSCGLRRRRRCSISSRAAVPCRAVPCPTTTRLGDGQSPPLLADELARRGRSSGSASCCRRSRAAGTSAAPRHPCLIGSQLSTCWISASQYAQSCSPGPNRGGQRNLGAGTGGLEGPVVGVERVLGPAAQVERREVSRGVLPSRANRSCSLPATSALPKTRIEEPRVFDPHPTGTQPGDVHRAGETGGRRHPVRLPQGPAQRAVTAHRQPGDEGVLRPGQYPEGLATRSGSSSVRKLQ